MYSFQARHLIYKVSQKCIKMQNLLFIRTPLHINYIQDALRLTTRGEKICSDSNIDIVKQYIIHYIQIHIDILLYLWTPPDFPKTGMREQKEKKGGGGGRNFYKFLTERNRQDSNAGRLETGDVTSAIMTYPT